MYRAFYCAAFGHHVSSDGAGKINLAVAVGDNLPEEMTIQIHDDLISMVASMQAVTSFLRLFVDEESLALPDVFEGRIGVEARREDSRHFSVRTSILESLSVPAVNAEGLILELEAQSAPLTLLLNGPANTIDASLGLETLEAELPWQLIVDFLTTIQVNFGPNALAILSKLRVAVPFETIVWKTPMETSWSVIFGAMRMVLIQPVSIPVMLTVDGSLMMRKGHVLQRLSTSMFKA